MIILDTTSKSFEIVLGGSVSTSQLPFVCSVADISPTSFSPVSSDGVSNNTTPVTVAASPAASVSRQLKFLSVENADTQPATLTVQLNNSGTRRTVMKAVLQPGYCIIYNHDKGFCVYDTNGIAQSSNTSAGSGFYQTMEAAGTAETQRVKLNFLPPFSLADNSGNGSTDVSLSTPVQTLTDSSGITWNTSAGSNAYLLLTTAIGSTREMTISNAGAGQSYTLVVQQASTGGQAITFSGITLKVAGAGGGAVTLSTANNAYDVLNFYYDGTQFYCTYATTFS